MWWCFVAPLQQRLCLEAVLVVVVAGVVVVVALGACAACRAVSFRVLFVVAIAT